MEEEVARILEQSTKTIHKLQLLAAFFEDEILFKILVRTQVIHRLFETSPELDIHKLELYHLQFTESIVELLRKIKKGNEKAVSLLFDEILFNETLAAQLQRDQMAAETYEGAVQTHTVLINESIFRLYLNLSDYSRDNPFPKALYEFGNRYAKDHFYTVPDDLLEECTQYNLEDEYKNGYGIINKKLLGLQCKNEFNNIFICGLKAGEDTLEIYKMTTSDTYFSFYPRRNFYNEFDFAKINDLPIPEVRSSKSKMVQELTVQNEQLRSSESQVRKHITPEVKELLRAYFERISTLDFLDTSDHEVQANILRAMLNTNEL
jgi:hypothetical protein